MGVNWTPPSSNGDVISDLQLLGDLYLNNASRSDGPAGKRCRDLEPVRVDGVYDYMMFMGELATPQRFPHA